MTPCLLSPRSPSRTASSCRMEVATSPGPTMLTERPPNRAPFHLTPLCLYYVSSPSSESKTRFGVDDFEFGHHAELEASCYLEQRQQQQLMSFADELFHSGRLLPLKLPPRLQAINSGSCSPSPTLLSGSAWKAARSPFARRSSKGKDVDPFAVALEKVRQEDTVIRRGRASPGRRARSLSPLRTWSWLQGPPGTGSSSGTRTSQCPDFGTKIDVLPKSTTCRGPQKKVENKHFVLTRTLNLKEAGNGRSRGWLKEAVKAMRMRPLANWHGPFACFGHNL
ncbi:hypothetical protein B296_00048529 [Ensete ventricosum]|uniref:Uncharacterized protein n=1 Tax=Ensete ventricosum TaxID=4639 RepID=A0A426YU96_ENSVE|nr:hypothetical protein B296_00048529 [Ensete ventricosum]